jgi:hypothetical protein
MSLSSKANDKAQSSFQEAVNDEGNHPQTYLSYWLLGNNMFYYVLLVNIWLSDQPLAIFRHVSTRQPLPSKGSLSY